MYEFKKILIISFILIFSLKFIPLTFAQLQSEEYVLKAAYLERITRFTDWPEEIAMSDTSKPFIIKVIGENPFGTTLEQMYSTTKIKNKSVEIDYISKPKEIDDCHLLFISSSMEKKFPKIIEYTKDKPILTISDTEGFGDKGVLINLYLSEKRLRFEINETAVKESGLEMSYMLLKVAKIIHPLGGKK